MKAKNIITTTILLIAFSCINETEPVIPKGADIQATPHRELPTEEQIYENQTDKNTILNSFIRYSHLKKRYILDISEKDALSLGIKSDIYKDAQKRVNQMNEINKEHL